MFVVSAEMYGKTVYFRGMVDGMPIFDKFGTRTRRYKTRQGAASNVLNNLSKSYVEAHKIQIVDETVKKRGKPMKNETNAAAAEAEQDKGKIKQELTATVPEQTEENTEKPSIKHWIEVFKFGPLVLYMHINGNRFAMQDDTRRLVDLGTHKLFAWRSYWATVNRVMENRIGDELERQGKDRFGRDQFGEAENEK